MLKKEFTSDTTLTRSQLDAFVNLTRSSDGTATITIKSVAYKIVNGKSRHIVTYAPMGADDNDGIATQEEGTAEM